MSFSFVGKTLVFAVTNIVGARAPLGPPPLRLPCLLALILFTGPEQQKRLGYSGQTWSLLGSVVSLMVASFSVAAASPSFGRRSSDRPALERRRQQFGKPLPLTY